MPECMRLDKPNGGNVKYQKMGVSQQLQGGAQVRNR